MKKITVDILKKLIYYQKEVMSVEQLAILYNVTKRSIRNYLQELNEEYPGLVVVEKEQVLLSQDVLVKLQLHKQSISRQSQFFMKLVEYDKFDYFCFAQDVYVEVATVEKDIIAIRSFLKNYQIKLIKKNEYLYIQGDELQIRRAINEYIHKELDYKAFRMDDITPYFMELDTTEIENVLLSLCSEYEYELNYFTRYEALLDIYIALLRFNHLDKHSDIHSSQRLESFIQSFSKQIEVYTGVSLNTYEQEYMAYILENRIEVKDLCAIDEQALIKDKLSSILQQATIYFGFHLLDETLMYHLTLHIQQMLSRIQKGQVLKNPFGKNLKNQYPLGHEVSVYIVTSLERCLDVHIPKDEISFFTLHIGSFLMRNKKSNMMLSTLLVCPSYKSIQQQFERVIKTQFIYDIHVDCVIEELTTLTDVNKYEMIIATEPLRIKENTAFVSPLLNKDDLRLIQDTIEQTKYKKRLKEVYKFLKKASQESLYFQNIYKDSSEEYITFMAEKIVQQKHSTKAIAQSIIDREHALSTAFHHMVALPHTLEVTLPKSTMCIIQNKKQIRWNDDSVSIILMFVLNEKDREVLSNIYDTCVNIFSNKEFMNMINNISTYDEFMNCLKTYVNDIA